MVLKYLFVSIIIVIISAMPTIVYAKDLATPSARTTEKIALEASKSAIKASKREAFQEKLATIKNEKKKEVVTRLDGNFTKINTNTTTRLLETITKFKAILSRITQKQQNLKTAGQDTALLEKAIETTTTKIALAESAITAQAQKEYVVTITTEKNLKINVSVTVKLLETDLKATRTTVTNAQSALRTTAMELEKLKKTMNSATESGELNK